jgi:hypothetical protein
VPEELGVTVQEAQVVEQGLVGRVGAQDRAVGVDVVDQLVDARRKSAERLQSPL